MSLAMSEATSEGASHTLESKAWEQTRMASRILRTISPELHNVLLELYWTHYAAVIRLVSMDLFQECRGHSNGSYYSHFLHVAMLAIGYRFADHDDPSLQKITISDKESTFHRDAKLLLWYDVQNPTIASVAALLLLSDLECGIGNGNLGRRYTGMACHIALGLGLNLDCNSLGISVAEIQTRRQILSSCSLFDKYVDLVLGYLLPLKTNRNLALLIGRLPSMKVLDVGLSRPLEWRNRESRQSQSTEEIEEQILVAIGDLQQFISKILDITMAVEAPNKLQDGILSIYLSVADLNREITTWYQSLPQELQWTSNNEEIAPLSFFLLNQQYYAALITIHKIFAWNRTESSEPGLDGGTEHSHLQHLAAISQSVCSNYAVQIARIFEVQKSRFDISFVNLLGLQTITTAAGTLIDGISQTNDAAERELSIRHLKILTRALTAMRIAYKPAEIMVKAIHNFLEVREQASFLSI